MGLQLSEGSLEIIMNGGNVDEPIMQILGSKRIQGNGSVERYRLLVSDGRHSHSFAMLATQLNDRFISGELCDYTVVKIKRFITSILNDTGRGEKRVMIILDVAVIESGDKIGMKIGNPQTWSEKATSSAPSVQPPPPQPAPHRAPSVFGANKTNMHPSNSHGSSTVTSMDSSMLSGQMTHPISSLSPYQNKWVIKVRVMGKSPIRRWSNAKGEGSLFSMDLCDESGEIRATAFKAECDKFYDMIEVDRVYYISRCSMKTANKQYSSLKNDYEISFTPDTVVALCTEDISEVPTVKYNFIPISKIADQQPDTIHDIIGVCRSSGEVQELTARSTGRQLKKREITLVDSSGGAVILTMWGSEAETFDGTQCPIIAVKGARLTEFNGSKSMSCMSSSVFRLNPDLPEAHKLKGWYDNGGSSMEVVNVSSRAGGSMGGSGDWITFSEADARQLGSGEKGDYFSLLGVISFVSSDNAVYKACPTEQCNKKLIDQENGMYRCEKCNREFPNYKYRLLMFGNVSDHTGDQRVTAFNEAGEVMLDRTSAEVGQSLETDKQAYVALFEDLKFKTFVFKFRTKIETYNDEPRLKTTIISVQPVDYKDANARMLKYIKSSTGIELN